jgi:FMN phosphatase YigB (HAD superfamily)
MAKLILWDFGNTLADERWLAEPMAGAPGWTQAYRERVSLGALGRLWDAGAISTRDVAAALAAALGVGVDAAVAHMEASSRRICFFPKVMAFVERRAAPQAIVTINPDIFTDVVVPAYRLDRQVDVIVTSWQQRTADKCALCERALAQLGITAPLAECLLVDDRVDYVLAWRRKGGAAYHFTGEEIFSEEFPAVFGGERAPEGI